MKRTLLLIGLAAAVLVFAAFAAGAVVSAAAPQAVSISETEFALTPNSFTVQAGQPVQFTVTNNGKIQHNIKVELPSAGIEQKLFDTNLQPGETRTATYTFSQAGDWEIYCPVGNHEAAGMKGTVTVLAASAAPAAAATPASSATTAPTGSTSGSPSNLPTTGGDPTSPLALIAIGVLAIALGGFALWELATARND